MATTTTTPARRPPPSNAGAVAWIRENLFNSIGNTITTVVLAVLIGYAAIGLYDWGFANAVFAPDNEACRAATGACWGFVTEKHRLMAFGLYPYEEQWRPLLASILLITLLVVTCMPAFWNKSLALGWLFGIPLVLVLMGGEVSYILALMVALGVGMLAGVTPRRLAMAGAIAFAALVVLTLMAASGLIPELPALPAVLTPVETERWGGLPLTLILATFGILLSFPLALLLALGRASSLPAIKALCVGFIELVRGVPLITILFMSNLMVPLFLPEGVNFDKLLRAQIGFILFAAAYVAEVIRGGLAAVPKGQYEAADAMGLGYWQKMSLIILPQALKHVVVPMVSTFISLFKDTSLVIIIGMYDLLGAVRAGSDDPEWQLFYVEGLLAVAAIYFVMCYAMAAYARWIEDRLDTSNR